MLALFMAHSVDMVSVVVTAWNHIHHKVQCCCCW